MWMTQCGHNLNLTADSSQVLIFTNLVLSDCLDGKLQTHKLHSLRSAFLSEM